MFRRRARTPCTCDRSASEDDESPGAQGDDDAVRTWPRPSMGGRRRRAQPLAAGVKRMRACDRRERSAAEADHPLRRGDRQSFAKRAAGQGDGPVRETTRPNTPYRQARPRIGTVRCSMRQRSRHRRAPSAPAPCGGHGANVAGRRARWKPPRSASPHCRSATRSPRRLRWLVSTGNAVYIEVSRAAPPERRDPSSRCGVRPRRAGSGMPMLHCLVDEVVGDARYRGRR